MLQGRVGVWAGAVGGGKGRGTRGVELNGRDRAGQGRARLDENRQQQGQG